MMQRAFLLSIFLAFTGLINAQEMKDYQSAGQVGRIHTLREETAKLIDESGQLQESKRFVSEELIFNEKGDRISTRIAHPDGRTWTENTFSYEYDGQGRIQVMLILGPDGKLQYKFVNTYNTNGKVNNKAYFDKNGQPVFVLIYTYNEAGKVSRMQDSRRPGKGYFDAVYTYSTDGIEADRKDYTADCALRARIITTYDTGGKETEAVRYNEVGKVISRSQCSYDGKDKNNVTEVAHFGRGDIVESRAHFIYDEFDEKGNWTKRHTVRETARGSEIVKQMEITYRTFTYY